MGNVPIGMNMNSANTMNISARIPDFLEQSNHQYGSKNSDPNVLTDIYREDINIAVWQRQLPATLTQAIAEFLIRKPAFNASMTVSSKSALNSINESLGAGMDELSENIAGIVDMFCCLFELKRVGLRLAVVDNAMCPKFHVDKVPCRLVTTFQGAGTEWLSHGIANRDKLGHGSAGKPDHESGLYRNHNDIQKLYCGDVALLKGERWEGNENAGLIHRSPAVTSHAPRLVLTLDFSY